MLPQFGKPNQEETPELRLHKEGLDLSKEQLAMEASSYDDQYYMQEKEERDQLLRWQQDLNPELNELKHDLLNEYLNDDKEWMPIPGLKPKLNKKGIAYVFSVIKPHVDRNTMRCTLDAPTINKTMKIIGNALAIGLAVNYDTFEINMTEYHSLNIMIRNKIHFTMLRALNDGERKNEREIIRSIETSMRRPEQPQKKSVFGFGG